MATIAHTIDDALRFVERVIWTPLATGDAGQKVGLPLNSDKTVQAIGTFSASVVTMQGSNNGADWFTLNDALGNTLVFTAPGGAQCLENPIWIRPNVTAGAAAALTVIIAASKQS